MKQIKIRIYCHLGVKKTMFILWTRIIKTKQQYKFV